MTIYSFSGENRFLSNFYPAPVEIDGISYPTTEHAYQACKTRNRDEAIRISRLATAAEAKKAGREVVLRPDWDQHKGDWMRAVLDAKFLSHPELEQKLIDTGDELLIEGNSWHDQTWGSCSCPRHIDTPGENLLGQLLMKVRAELKATRADEE